MYKVIKGFAGVEVGEKIELNKNDAEYMIKEGYVKADKAKRKTKVDPEAENLKNK